jgi:hypothetical protein
VLIAAALVSCASAQALDPQLQQPYRLQVILGVAPHRLLTDLFKDQVERELRDSLQAALGELATVEIVRQHPKLKEVQEKGLQQALDSWKDLSDQKTHFVLVDYVNGQYEVQSRQFDGMTAMASNVVRRERVTRGFVARAAALQISGDFGLVGTIADKDHKQPVRIALKGGGLGLPLSPWVKKGEVFALAQITRRGAGLWATQVPWALVQVVEEPKDGVCIGRVYNLYRDPLGDRAVAGCRCLKLSTIKAPLRMRLVQTGKALAPLPNVLVHVRQEGQAEKEADQAVTDADGFFEIRKDYSNVALVSVMDNSTGKARLQIPVPIVDTRTVTCPVSLALDSDPTLYTRRNLWVSRLYDNLNVQQTFFQDLAKTLSNPNRQATLDKVLEGLKNLDDDLESFRKEKNNLVEAAKKLPPGALDLSKGDHPLRELERGRTQLAALKKRLEDNLTREKDPKRKELLDKIEQARILEENEAEFGKALDIYEECLKGDLDNPEMFRQQVAAKRAAWALKNQDSHRKADTFIYSEWPTLDLVRDRSAVQEARKAFEACRSVGDKLRPRKLLIVANAHVDKLEKERAGLQPDVNEDHFQTVQVIGKVAEELGRLIRDVTEYLK